MRRAGERGDDLSWPPVLDVLEHYFGYEHLPRRHQAWAPVRCPFHQDRNASASVSEGANIFFCHGCGVSTTGLGIVMRKEGVDVHGAESIAAGLFGESGRPVRDGAASGSGIPGRAGDRRGNRKKIPIRRRHRTLLGA